MHGGAGASCYTGSITYKKTATITDLADSYPIFAISAGENRKAL